MAADASIQYQVRLADPAAHIFEVSCKVPEPDPAGQVFTLPGWIPGSYLVRDYARHVLAISARSGGSAVAVTKTTKASWQCAPCVGELVVTCEVYAYDLSVRGAYLDTRRGFFNGACLFLEVRGAGDEHCELDVMPPDSGRVENAGDWRVATAMLASETDERGFGRYTARSYDELIDHPFEISNHDKGNFVVSRVPHEIVLAGRHRADIERLCKDVPRICEQHIKLFDDDPPMARYVFLTNVVGEGYGGLEHRASCALITRRSDLPGIHTSNTDKSYRRFLGLVSHEYFHLWNIKRIKPAAFTPFDLTRESYTRLLWVFEGVTSYYDDLALVRSGVIEPMSYLELLADNISKVMQTPGRHRQTLADSSFDAWIKLYKPDENTPNAVISYYSKGLLIALALDLKIRQQTGGEKSLDDVMRALWSRYGKQGVGLEEHGFEQLAAEISGLDLRAFFDAAIRTTEDPPLQALLQTVGIRMEMVAAPDAQSGDSQANGGPDVALGVRLRETNGRLEVASVLAGGPAAQAGLAGGDELVAVDDLRVTSISSYASLLAGYRAGDKVAIRVFRRDELLRFEICLAECTKGKCKLTLVEDVSDEIEGARNAWLGQ